MQVHKIVLMVIDLEGLGQKGVIEEIENVKYPNYCISPKVMCVDTRDCGEWHDDHPLNKKHTYDAEIKRLFEN